MREEDKVAIAQGGRALSVPEIGRWLADDVDRSRAIWRPVTKGLRKQRLRRRSGQLLHYSCVSSKKRSCKPASGLLLFFPCLSEPSPRGIPAGLIPSFKFILFPFSALDAPLVRQKCSVARTTSIIEKLENPRWWNSAVMAHYDSAPFRNINNLPIYKSFSKSTLE
jgi:hypothetical protein